jgi:hypothetical protein
VDAASGSTTGRRDVRILILLALASSFSICSPSVLRQWQEFMATAIAAA